MIITPHALIGAGIGSMIDNLSLVFILGFLSHFILDAIPHTDQGTLHFYEKDYELNFRDYVLAGIDAIFAFIILALIVKLGRDDAKYILIGALGAITPDLINHVPLWKNKLKKYSLFVKFSNFHRLVNYQLAPKYWYWGVFTQMTIMVVSLLLLIR